MNNPPKLPLLFFRWFCHPDLLLGIEGDLMELFDENEKDLGITRAKWKFTWDVLKLVRPSIIRPAGGTHRMNYYGLWKHHFKMAGRQLFRNKVFSIISILGLGVGFAAFFVVLQYVTYELSFDQFYENKDEIYRVICLPGDREVSARNYSGLRGHLESNFPEVKNVAWFWRYWNLNEGDALKVGDKIFFERNVINTSSSFFETFPSLLSSGDPGDVLQSKSSIVIAEHIARKYFGNSNPLGQIIKLRRDDYVVSGISVNMPDNSHFSADIYILNSHRSSWETFSLYTYITLDKTVSVPEFEAKLTQSVRNLKDEFPNLADDQFRLQPITDIHLHSNLTRELGANNNVRVIYFLAASGFLVLFMAWFNHINLSTSMFFTRIREMSIRKVVGSGKYNLMAQLVSEYSLVMLIAIILAIAVVMAISPMLVNEGIIPDMLQVYRPKLLWGGVSLFILGSLLTGLYPGILLSGFKSSSALKGKFTSTKFGLRMRSILVIFQFVASLGLIIGVTVLMKQLDHLRSTDRKMNVDNVISVHNPTVLSSFEKDELLNYLNFKNRMEAHSAIVSLASSSAIPGSEVSIPVANQLKIRRTDPYDPTLMKIIYIDDDFFDVFEIPLLAGRSYSSDNQQDLNQESVMLSKSAIEHLGFRSASDAVNTEIDFNHYGDEFATVKIVGVFDDYQHESTKSKGYPSIMTINRGENYIHIHQYHSFKVANDDQTEAALEHLIKTWDAVWPEKPLEYYFVDQVYEQQFCNEKVLSDGFILFSIIAVIIAGLGLLGMTVYEIQLRTKEISIRKVMGSSISGLVKLLSQKYLGLLGLAILIATPLCTWLSNVWLEGYPDRIELTPSLFIPAIGIMLFIVLVSSGTLIYQAANTNPAENLKDE